MPGKTFDARVIELGESIGLLVRRSRALAASEELSWTEASVLKRLGKDGPSTTADLARAQGMRPQSMRTIVTALEEMGMIERAPHSTDGRQVNLTLTAKGAAVEKRVGDRKRNWLAQAISRLSERDQATLFESQSW